MTVHDLAIIRVLHFVYSGEATSRAEIARRTGLARSTVSQQVEHLIDAGLIEEIDAHSPGRGRPPRTLRVARSAGVVAVADIDTQQTTIAIADLKGAVLAEHTVRVPVDRGPTIVLDEVERELRALLVRIDGDVAPLRRIVVGVPGPVDFRRGRAVRPPIMPGWDGHPIGDDLRNRFGVPVVVDNDVNLAALAESAQDYAITPLIVVKVAYGVGAGIVGSDGALHRGADGAAGDIGHIRTAGNDGIPCHCGQVGCLEAVASLTAVMRGLDIPHGTAVEFDTGIETLRERIRSGDSDALRALRNASRVLGEVLAAMIQMFNPRTLVIGGPLNAGHDDVLSGVRGLVYERAVPLTTRDLTLTTSQLGSEAGVLGGIQLALQLTWNAAGMSELLEATQDHGASSTAALSGP